MRRRREGHAAQGQDVRRFLDRLVTTALPRVRDFRGVSPKSFDGRGNYGDGPCRSTSSSSKIDYDRTETVWGMDIIIQTTSAKTDEEAQGASRRLPDAFHELHCGLRSRPDNGQKKSQINRNLRSAEKIVAQYAAKARRAEGSAADDMKLSP